LSKETEESLCVKLLTCREFHLGQFKAFRMTIWTCVRVPQNLRPACWSAEELRPHNLCGGLKENSEFHLYVMRHRLKSTTQNVSNSHLSRRAHHFHACKKASQFTPMWRAYSLFWHLVASAGKCVGKSTWKVEFGGLVSLPWQRTCSLSFVCVCISG
jgi:hypothetical protein